MHRNISCYDSDIWTYHTFFPSVFYLQKCECWLNMSNSHRKNVLYLIESAACMQNNGGCSTFCLPTPTGRACACEEGADLMADGETCEVTGGKKAISSSCFQLHYIHVLFLYMYTSSTCTLIDRCCRTLFMIKDYLNRSVLFWGCSKRCLVSYLSPAPHRDVHLHV